MVLACDQPDKVRHCYEETTGAPLICGDSTVAPGPGASTPQWALVVGVVDPEGVVARAHDHGQDLVTWSDEAGRRVVRLSSPEGPAFQVRHVEQ
ncbi:hypothetical protein OG596_10060 [Streptomyces sp. NBC_01102]|uniref:hypothetical protein n=1 Tax=Streptomyces sp. NBC_01102 TaxID=2903749 RepID=UPI003869125D|nr:hypothetical protein OG596_10060 [Streptomyces sp. NBC_01102]